MFTVLVCRWLSATGCDGWSFLCEVPRDSSTAPGHSAVSAVAIQLTGAAVCLWYPPQSYSIIYGSLRDRLCFHKSQLFSKNGCRDWKIKVNNSVYMRACIYACVTCVCTCVCECVHVCACMYVCLCACVILCMCISSICMYVCMCIYACVRACMRSCV